MSKHFYIGQIDKSFHGIKLVCRNATLTTFKFRNFDFIHEIPNKEFLLSEIMKSFSLNKAKMAAWKIAGINLEFLNLKKVELTMLLVVGSYTLIFLIISL